MPDPRIKIIYPVQNRVGEMFVESDTRRWAVFDIGEGRPPLRTPQPDVTAPAPNIRTRSPDANAVRPPKSK